MTVVEAMRAFRGGAATEAATFRAVVGHDAWWVPVGDQGQIGLFPAAGGAPYLAALTEQRSPDGRPCGFVQVSGRHLARNVPADAAGVAFEYGTDHALLVESASTGAVLRRWAGAVDVEDALAAPGPGQAEALVEHDWLVLHADHVPAIDGMGDLRVVHAFTAPDRVEAFFAREPSFRSREVRLVRGGTWFAALAARDGWDAVAVNRRAEGADELPPAAVHALAAGRDERLGVAPLRARTVAEIHLFLDLLGVSTTDRSHVLVYAGPDLVARYDGAVAGGRLTVDVVPVAPTEDPLDLGEGRTRILCAGALAEAARIRLGGLPDDPAKADAAERRQAAQAGRWLFELEKLLPEGGDRIGRDALSTSRGARWARERPFLLEREWLGKARRWAEALAGTV